jgi:hypothetical protein
MASGHSRPAVPGGDRVDPHHVPPRKRAHPDDGLGDRKREKGPTITGVEEPGLRPNAAAAEAPMEPGMRTSAMGSRGCAIHLIAIAALQTLDSGGLERAASPGAVTPSRAPVSGGRTVRGLRTAHHGSTLAACRRVSMDRTRPLSHIAVAVIGFGIGCRHTAPAATVPFEVC